MHEIFVILSQCAHWRENPYSFVPRYGLPHHLSGLVRNDTKHFATGHMVFFYFTAAALSAFLQRQIQTAAMAATTRAPGRKPVPTVPSVIRVPIW